MKAPWIWIGLALLLMADAESRPPDSSGNGFVENHEYADAMSDGVRAMIELELEQSAERLKREGKLQELSGSPDPMSFGWPLNARPGFEFDDYHAISNFVDLNSSFPNQLLDYMCGTRTYDLDSGYNHAGIDYYLWPYSWRMMDQEMIEIVAVAPGVILAKHDGNSDRNCSLGGDMWNAVYVQHADGTVAWYGHMKNGSTTDKLVGESVVEGEYLGLVGSSGNSTGPHLHLEFRSSSMAGATIYEPHAGICRTGDSLWQSQRAYHDTALNGVGVHNAQPSLAVTCPNPGQEASALVDQVPLGDPIWFSIYLRDALDTQPIVGLTLYRPDGEIYHQWSFDFNPGAPTHYSGAWWWWTWSSGLGTNPAFEGVWTFEATMGDQTVSREFVYGDVQTIFADRFEE